MADQPQDKASVQPLLPTISNGGHKNPPVGPTTGKQLPDWRMSRAYENFNPTAEK